MVVRVHEVEGTMEGTDLHMESLKGDWDHRFYVFRVSHYTTPMLFSGSAWQAESAKWVIDFRD